MPTAATSPALSIGGYSFAYDAQTNTLSASGSSDSVTAYQFDPVARTLTLTTVQGETLRIGLCDGSFRYHVDETPVRGSHTPTSSTHWSMATATVPAARSASSAPAPPANVAPVAGIRDRQQPARHHRPRSARPDRPRDPHPVHRAGRQQRPDARRKSPTGRWSTSAPTISRASLALAAELGLHVEITKRSRSCSAWSCPVRRWSSHAADGGQHRQPGAQRTARHRALRTVLCSTSAVLSATSITATDSHGLSSTANVGSLAEVSLIHSPDSDPRLVEGR